MSAGAPVRKRSPGDLLGVPIALTDYRQAMEVMDGMIARRERGYVCAIAVHALMVARQDEGTRRALRGSSLTVPDGRPLVWALGMLGDRLSDRVYGPELMARYCSRAAGCGHRVSLYGGYDDQAVARLCDALERRYPGITIAGAYPPLRSMTSAEEDRLVERLNADRPDVVWVGLGAPRQENWMARMRPRLEAPVLVGVGAAFDFYRGVKRQAPAWMQAGTRVAVPALAGAAPPAPRYLRYNPAFVAAFARQYMRERRRRRDAKRCVHFASGCEEKRSAAA